MLLKDLLRINATDKANNVKDQTVALIYDNRFCIPLDFEILDTSLPLYQYGLGCRLTYELTFADYSDVIKSTDPDATYTISNISLEFDTMINASLASQIRTEYMKSSILYDRILRVCIIPLNKSDTSFSVDINSPSKSLKGVLLIFTQERSATKGPVKLIKRVKIAHSFLQSVLNQFHVIILSLPIKFYKSLSKKFSKPTSKNGDMGHFNL